MWDELSIKLCLLEKQQVNCFNMEIRVNPRGFGEYIK